MDRLVFKSSQANSSNNLDLLVPCLAPVTTNITVMRHYSNIGCTCRPIDHW